jgi:nitrate/nitrite transport system ATP-binding protein
MTNGPAATIGEILSVQLERPRNRIALGKDPRYMEYRQKVIEFLYMRHAKPELVAA